MSVRHEITCAEFRSMAGAYSLETLDPAERMACTHHLSGPAPHQGCFTAVAEAQRVTDLLAAAVPLQPPPADLWPAIEARVLRTSTVTERRNRMRTPIAMPARAKQDAHR